MRRIGACRRLMKLSSNMWPQRLLQALRANRRVAFVFLLSLVAGSCITFRETAHRRGPTDEGRGYKYSHALHKQAGLEDCTTCHDPASAEPSALIMPAHDLCSTCHEIPDVGTTPPADPAELAKCNFCHIRPDFSVTKWKTAFSEELKWQHAPHVAASIECAVCHQGPEEAKLRPDLTMDSCMQCHAKQKPGLNECAVCHTQITRDTIPTMRRGQRIAHDAPLVWQKIHGQEAQVDRAYCATCHDTKDSCNECHSRVAPADHTIAWRNKSHGLHANWDRNRCATCHEEDTCVKCHNSREPASHRAGWSGPVNRHCVSCHFPAQKNECVVCHENIDHREAKRSPHAAGIYPPNCARCHPGNVPYLAPHPLNSTVKCVQCHR